MWGRYLLSSAKKKNRLKEQVEIELSAQISKVLNVVSKGFVFGLDSHQHVHLIPFVGEIVCLLGKRFGARQVRVPREKFIWSWADLRRYRIANLLKHFLLNILSSVLVKKLRGLGLSFRPHFVGVLFTGCMSKSFIEKSMRCLRALEIETEVEVLLHPGEGKKGEESLWRDYPSLLTYYFSSLRSSERALLKETSL